MKWARVSIILSIIALAGWLAWLKVSAQDIGMIISAISVPAGLYVGLKGRGGNGAQ